MGKYKLPTLQKILKTKTIYGKKKDPVWVYLEKEMLENVEKKPYNEKVGRWLGFLKDLRYYKHQEGKRKERRLQIEAGPRWYVELSNQQKRVLSRLKQHIHQDLLEDIPRRMRKDLSDLGITLKVPRKVLMKAMADCIEDPGVFFWKFYEAVYNRSPNELIKKYDMNARIIISCLVSLDMNECITTLNKLTASTKSATSALTIKKKKPAKSSKESEKYGHYLQKSKVPIVTSYPDKKETKKPEPLDYKFRLRSDESYDKLIKSTEFLDKRKERNKREKQQERVCNYKFWEAPSTLRNTDPKMVAYVEKLRVLKKKARPKFTAPFENVQYLVTGVAFAGGRPHFVLACVATLPTGYIAINDGVVVTTLQAVTCIDGYWKYPKDEFERCEHTCDCLEKWEPTVMEFLQDSKCKCGHLYDFYNTEVRNKEKYFYPPTRHGPGWIDEAKVYQLDPTEDFIKETLEEAVKSDETLRETSQPTVNASGLKESELLAAFLADLADSPLLIPHLPQANLLNNLKQWARNRVKGKLTLNKHKRMLLQSQRRWLDLKHMDFRARAYRIPFTLKQLKNINWSHRKLIQNLFDILMDDFVTRNRKKQVEQTRLWWSTTKYDSYPNEAFLDVFFTYLPGRMKDTHFINPYSAELTPKWGAKTCSLRN